MQLPLMSFVLCEAPSYSLPIYETQGDKHVE